MTPVNSDSTKPSEVSGGTSNLNVPAGWVASKAADGGIDLRVSTRGRPWVASVAAGFAALIGWNVGVRWEGLTFPELELRCAMITLLALFALWCGFADEFWHISRNCVIHSVGIRDLRFKRRIQDAELQIVERFGAKFSTPYYRLYALSDGEQRFLFQRKRVELEQLAYSISAHTGWGFESNVD
jgi:hypothetical protein